MTGIPLKLQVRDKYCGSVEAGHTKEGHFQVIYFSTEMKVLKFIVCYFI